MYERFIEPNKDALFIVGSIALAVWAAYLHWDWVSACWIGSAVFKLHNRYGERLKALETEIATLRSQLAAAPPPVLNQAPEQG
ncbi:MAG TPA: hypothetical protein VN229_03935 [Terriglobales bacterium]|nr:hypothetical protein [Terriglobales bacterium]